jgi:hypothetical protein
METDKTIILCPCSGRARLNIPRGHIYHAKNRITKEDLGFITEEIAKEKYGEGNYFLSFSDSLCPICSYDIRHGPKLISVTD